MPRKPRYEVADPAQVQVFHAVQRCVRRAFLCGEDPLTGRSFEHRRQWIRDRLEFMASVFGIDCLTYSVMSNHLHLVLRSRPDVVAAWSDQEVAGRWLRLFPARRRPDGSAEPPTEADIAALVNHPEVLAERRRRLSDVSWWMRCVAEFIARRANREDECTGRFWEGRYRLQNLLDEASLLACAAYVDLNPVRAAIAETPESSPYTGAKDRIDDLPQQPSRLRPSMHEWERSRRRRHSGWMSPVEINEAKAPVGPCVEKSGRRASSKGFLGISLVRYLELLDWTGRQLRSDKLGSIPKHLAPILSRIGVDTRGWCDVVRRFGRVFKRAAGTPESLAREAVRCGQHWMCAPDNPLGLCSD
ncbi:hypothetical protein [Crateriforma conspicua]|uniref:Transposase IS200-like domain-containing protein n=1 Tax=Crateriforma conspicua TaxID=2527996 RepID=A0A5C5YA53_9PLAN|nr:hypothetical protein [Crateriforma conspicua]TWT71703.1 hypothetical protein Pan14r_40190 [Crateriforma conspicua]